MKLQDSDIVEFLHSHRSWQSAQTMAVQFGVSARTIRNHISKINEVSDVVESGQLGYRIKGEKVNTANEQSQSIPAQIFAILFASPRGSASMASVIAQTYFSEATVKDAVGKFNMVNAQNKVQIRMHNAALTLAGTEYNRRRLFHRYAGGQLRNFGQQTPFDLSHLVPNVPIDSLQQIITSVVNRHDLVINGYEMSDLLLHYAISMNRITLGNSYNQFVQNESLKKRDEFGLTLQITKQIAKQFNLQFNEYEVSALTLALIGKTITRDTNKHGLDDLEQYVPKAVINACLSVIEQTSHEYNLQLNDPNFQVRFIIHVNNMVSRAKFGQSPQASDFNQLTKQYPLLYEMALYMLESLSTALGIDINKRESVYLLLHLGSYLENDQKHLINTVVIAPEYYNTNAELLERLNQYFGHELRITQVLTQLPGEDIQADSRLIITTQDLNTAPNQHVIKVSPLLSSIDIARVHQEIEQISHQEWVQKNIDYLHQYMSKSLFFSETDFVNKHEALAFGAKQLEIQGYTGPKFFDEIIKRENLAATDFGTVAIPHTMRMKANYTGILIMINQRPVSWTESNGCQLIIMIAVSNNSVHIFGELLQVMISTLSIKQNVDTLLKCTDYDEFMLHFEDMFSQVHQQDI
ncbi:BglG family transcription antiterminator [Lacticaseibacillus pantheris]|uniref:BglG family transcription antiterminator n=1 Tax=Lacticaseibacillus pantheris TaxID=171523 RepID=UPI00265AFE30|nr:PRD domain-containing protein [Lacticaseibacillus pantheris]WKF84170.1 PRD domain-containing protein [Lacticaseibacillus pantheris]